MNNIKTYFPSPGKKCSTGATTTQQLSADGNNKRSNFNEENLTDGKEGKLDTAKENDKNGEGFECTSPIYIIKKPSLDSKLILQNMEEVLNSVKRKHRQKHRRKKEQKKMAQLEAEAVAAAMKAKAGQQNDADAQKHQGDAKKPLSVKTDQVNGDPQVVSSKSKQTPTTKSSLKTSVSTNGTTVESLMRDASVSALDAKNTNNTEVKEPVSMEVPKDEGSPKKVTRKTNAFEVLMNARNKSIGSNTPGKELSADEEATTSKAAAARVKRKLLLEDWANRKGGIKRKLDEESRAAYVEKQLESRAKRFKKMLVSGSSPKSKDDHEVPANNTRIKSNESRQNKLKKEHSTDLKQKPEEPQDEKPKRKRIGTRKQRLASFNSDVEITPSALVVQNKETAEFLEKLSSPSKKRDSLLGYFPKKDSQKKVAKKTASIAKESEDTPKRSQRLISAKQAAAVDNASPQPPPPAKKEDISISNGRPRRSCAAKARYDYDLQVSPTKLQKTPKTSKTEYKNAVEVSDEEMVTIELDDSASNTPEKQKLAPLFVRSASKPSTDPVRLQARQAFLMSGVPEKLRIEQVKQKQFEQNYEEAFELFPKVSHVQQLTAQDQRWTGENITITFKLKPDEDDPTVAGKNRRSKGKKPRDIGCITGCRDRVTYSPPCMLRQPLVAVPEKRLIIKAWKTKYERFPIYRCYNQMREKYRYFSAIDSEQDTEQVSESFVVTRRSSRRSLKATAENEQDVNSEDAKPPAMAPNGELMFTEKYKPLLFEQFLVNLSPVSELREFLANWSTRPRNPQGVEDLDYNEDSNSSSSSQQAVCNTVVLMGPSSSGKTSAIFAVANELNLNVLEINAGMKRTGKKVIQELQEATQSHQLRKNTTAQSNAQKNLIKMTLNGSKSKGKSSSKNSSIESNSQSPSKAESSSTTARKCVILIEDADIVFDQMDAGFTDAIYTLAASSKRPVVVVASNPKCPHLQRLIQQNTIYFKEPSALNISRYMAVLALLENCPVKLDDLILLYIYNKKDLRKTLLELQFFIQSGGDCKTEQPVEKVACSLYASPTKRRFSEEASCSQANDDLPNKEPSTARSDVESKLYVHQDLFSFFTSSQNEVWRVPFPVDFNVLRYNLDEILRASTKLQAISAKPTDKQPMAVEPPTTKRKSRSPKKVWLTAAAAQQTMPLADLCDFYESISIACLLGAHGNALLPTEEGRPQFKDELMPDLKEEMAYNLVANAIDHDLEAQAFSYNLIYSPLKKTTLSGCFSQTPGQSQRSLALDFEPTLRSICRSEKLRAAQERRSTRFYHYLRNISGSPVESFEDACSIFANDADITGNSHAESGSVGSTNS